MPRDAACRPLSARDKRSWFRYRPVSPSARAWGVYVADAGYTLIPPGSPYPPYRHPAGHHFTWAEGRILSSFQFVYLSRGEGEFETGPSGLQRVRAGDLFIVFPDIWHRYRPDPRTGWDEYWLEFDGDYARRLMARKPFAPDQPVLRVGHPESLTRLFLEAMETLRHEPPEHEALLGALVVQVIAQTLSAVRRQRREGRSEEEIVREAKALLADAGGRAVPLAGIAAQLNLGYTTFRRRFKGATGFSPRQFALHVAIQRAEDLLARTSLPVGRIAEELGFDSIYYFSRLFKRKTGRSPAAYRSLRRNPAGRRSKPGPGATFPV